MEVIELGLEHQFETILSRYESRIYNFALQLTNNTNQAEAILIDVFSSIFEEIQDTRQGKFLEIDFVTCLYQLTLKYSLRSTEQEVVKVTKLVEQLQYHQFKSTEKSFETQTNPCTELSNLITRLPEEYKHVFLLRDVQGISENQTSEILGLPRITVRAILSRARLLVKRLMKDYLETNARQQMSIDLNLISSSQVKPRHL